MSGLWSFRARGEEKSTNNSLHGILPTLTEAYHTREELGLGTSAINDARHFFNTSCEQLIDCPNEDDSAPSFSNWIESMRETHEGGSGLEEIRSIMESVRSPTGGIAGDLTMCVRTLETERQEQKAMVDRTRARTQVCPSRQVDWPARTAFNIPNLSEDKARLPLKAQNPNIPETRVRSFAKASPIVSDLSRQASHLRTMSSGLSVPLNMPSVRGVRPSNESRCSRREEAVNIRNQFISGRSMSVSRGESLLGVAEGGDGVRAKATCVRSGLLTQPGKLSSESGQRHVTIRRASSCRMNHHARLAEVRASEAGQVAPMFLLPSKAREARRAEMIATREYEASCEGMANALRDRFMKQRIFQKWVAQLKARRLLIVQLRFIYLKAIFTRWVQCTLGRKETLVALGDMVSRSLNRFVLDTFSRWVLFTRQRRAMAKAGKHAHLLSIFRIMRRKASVRAQRRNESRTRTSFLQDSLAAEHYRRSLLRNTLRRLISCVERVRRQCYRSTLLAKAREALGQSCSDEFGAHFEAEAKNN